MAQWYLSYDGNQEGPFNQSEAASRAKGNPKGFAWRDGLTEWLPISQIGEFNQSRGAVPPPIQRKSADEIDFKIFGTEMQFVEIELDPGEKAVAEAGAMMYMDNAMTANDSWHLIC